MGKVVPHIPLTMVNVVIFVTYNWLYLLEILWVELILLKKNVLIMNDMTKRILFAVFSLLGTSLFVYLIHIFAKWMTI